MHPNDDLLLRRYACEYVEPDQRVLEVGPSFPSQVQRVLDPTGSTTWHSVDLFEHPSLTYLASDPYEFPIDDDTYDIVVAANVLEHVPKVWVWIKELARVARPGAHVITVNPVSWPFHEFPLDCWRAYPDGMRALYEEAGLEVLLSTCESLEAPDRPRRIPGRSQEYLLGHVDGGAFRKPRHVRYANRLLAKVGYPVERAFDTITIGRKGDRS